MLIALLVVAAIAVLLAVASMRPPTFRYERSTHIAAPMPQVAALIDDFHAWQKWSPWEQLDPALQRTYSGAATGVGAVYEWDSKGKAGTGRMEITDMAADVDKGLIRIKLDFLKPFKASNTAEFALTPTDSGTDITWAMFGPSPFISRLMGLFMNFESMVGKDFEKGLAAMKREAEQAA